MKIAVTFLFLLFTFLLCAQQPVSWRYFATKINPHTYEIHVKAKINQPWHLFSQKTLPGGPVPTTIHFSKNPVFARVQRVKEIGKLIKKFETVFGVDVLYYDQEVDFVQVVTLKRALKTNIRGIITYMACNDRQCLPPMEQAFTIALNDD